MKKLVAVILVVIMLLMYTAPAYAIDYASLYPYMGEALNVEPGNPRADHPEYKFSWLDNVIIRYDANAVTSAPVTPLPSDYLYSETFEEFVEDINSCSQLFELNENTVGSAYEDVTEALFYTLTAMGFTDAQNEMKEYLTEKGIKLPVNETAGDKAKIAVAYAAIKYDAVYVLYEKKVAIPAGSTLDEAIVIVLSALTGTMLPSGIDSLTGLGVLVTKNYVMEFEQLPLSENPDAAEIFHWAKVITAAENEYQVPLEAYGDTTKAQREYVDYAYYASILNTLYDINVDPIRLVIAMQSEEENSLQKFILKSMLDEKKVAYSDKATCEELFDLACQNGFFDLEQEFYADIFFYELKVPSNCEKVWFTPFSLAGQLEASNPEYVKIFLNGVQMAPGGTMSTPLDPSQKEEYVELKVTYADGVYTNDETVYTYKVVKDESLNAEGTGFEDGDIVGGVQQFVDTIVPDENLAASQKVDDVFSSIDAVADQITPPFSKDELTTYGTGGSSVGELLEGYDVTTKTNNGNEAGGKTTKRFDSKYLEDLIGGVYVTDSEGNIITTSIISEEIAKADGEGVVEKVAEAVKESPEIVAVPSSLLAAFSVAGYLMNRKHRDSVLPEEENEQEE